MTRKISTRLAARGHEVFVVVPKRGNQKSIEVLDGVKIIGVSKKDIFSKKVYSKINADIYHSQEPNFGGFVAMKAQPSKVHVVTCRDPRPLSEMLIEFKDGTWSKRLKAPMVYFYESGPVARYLVRNADVVGTPAGFLRKRVKKLYNLKEEPMLLPNLVYVPDNLPEKSKEPTVCFVGRFDKRKRPEIFFELAKKFPQVKFIAVGKAEELTWDRYLRDKYSHCHNLQMIGFINQFESNELKEIYSRSWVLINTSSREGLPLTFIEAAAHGCSILSHVDPDNFASEFGYHCKNDDFEEGLDKLLKEEFWRHKGLKAYEYVKNLYDEDLALDVHVSTYEKALLDSTGNGN